MIEILKVLKNGIHFFRTKIPYIWENLKVVKNESFFEVAGFQPLLLYGKIETNGIFRKEKKTNFLLEIQGRGIFIGFGELHDIRPFLEFLETNFENVKF